MIGSAQPAAAWSFWSGGMWDLGVGDTIVRADNQSLAGVVMRLTDQQDLATATQLVITVGALALGVWCASRVSDHELAGPLQMSIMAIAALLASPVSWTHHWVWIVPLSVVLIALRAWLLIAVESPSCAGSGWCGSGCRTAGQVASRVAHPAGCVVVRRCSGWPSMVVLTRHGSTRSQEANAADTGAAPAQRAGWCIVAGSRCSSNGTSDSRDWLTAS